MVLAFLAFWIVLLIISVGICHSAAYLRDRKKQSVPRQANI
jgi:hypothetical protein